MTSSFRSVKMVRLRKERHCEGSTTLELVLTANLLCVLQDLGTFAHTEVRLPNIVEQVVVDPPPQRLK